MMQLIRNAGNGHRLYAHLTIQDMLLIKGLYKTWWKEQQGKSIHEIRKEWEGKDIINSSSTSVKIFYKWI